MQERQLIIHDNEEFPGKFFAWYSDTMTQDELYTFFEGVCEKHPISVFFIIPQSLIEDAEDIRGLVNAKLREDLSL
jgi:hypothetical protein